MRTQPVVRIEVSPEFYHESQIIRVKRLQVRLTWNSSVQSADVRRRQRHPVIESLFREVLLNGEQLEPVLGTITATGVVNEPSEPQCNEVRTELANATSALKIIVDSAGIYQLSSEDIRSGGLDLNQQIGTFMLVSQCQRIPIFIDNIDEDDFISQTESILFYGETYEDKYTDENVYWLYQTAATEDRDTSVNLLHIGRANLIPSLVESQNHRAMLHLEENHVYWQENPNEMEDRYFWARRLSPSTEGLETELVIPFDLPDIDMSNASAPFIIEIALQGFTTTKHQTEVLLNGESVLTHGWHGDGDLVVATNPIPLSYTNKGNNTLVIRAVNADESVDQILVNWVRIHYDAIYVAQYNQLIFTPKEVGDLRFRINGFTQSESATVLNISNPKQPQSIIENELSAVATNYELSFADTITSSGSSKYIAATQSGYKKPSCRLPPCLIKVEPSTTWNSLDSEADYVIVTHSKFITAANNLKGHRESHNGFRVSVIPVEQLYDKFNDGLFSPEAIRKYLQALFDKPGDSAPLYLVLLGDGYQDYRNYLDQSTLNYVPSKTIKTDLSGEVSTDEWFGDLTDDPFPELLVGRLSAETITQALTITQKIIQYETVPTSGDWRKTALLVADDDIPDFAQTSQKIKEFLPLYYPEAEIDLNEEESLSIARSKLLDWLNRGVVFLNFIGHGEFFSWGLAENPLSKEPDSFLFHKEHLAFIDNEKTPAIVTIGNCINGFFTGTGLLHNTADFTSMAEALQRHKRGGAVAVWASTGYGFPFDHDRLLASFYGSLLTSEVDLGTAAAIAKVSVQNRNINSSWDELIQTYTLFGDPAMKAAHVNPPYVKQASLIDYNGNKETLSGNEDVALDAVLQFSFNKEVRKGTVAVSITNSAQSTVTLELDWDTEESLSSGTHVTVTRDVAWTPGSRHTVLVSGQDMAGNVITTTLFSNASFTTTSDSTVPELVNVTGTHGPELFYSTSVLTLTFDAAVRRGSLFITPNPPTLSSNRSEVCTLGWSLDGRSVRIPLHQFDEAQGRYGLLIGVTDMAGNRASSLSTEFNLAPINRVYVPILNNSQETNQDDDIQQGSSC
ncbi:MAG: C25 family cysteine peptidase [Chloroflexota bacterium]